MAKNDFIDHELASDDEIRDEEHGKLLQAVHMMDSQLRINPPTRTEPSLNISEFDLAPVKGGGVHLKDLARSLEIKGKSFDADVATKIRKLSRTNKTLVKPLEKPQAEKIKRIVAYTNLREHVGRWDALVQTNKAARTITFPMNSDSVHIKNTSDVAALWQSQTQTPLEAGLNALRGMSKVYEEDKKKEEKFRLTLAELRYKRQEIAKLRAQQSYEAAKCRRQKKIKSKSYHRIIRRDKMQKQLKDFEVLQKKDPEAALKQLEELEKVRAQERMTLRHKSTGHWARSRLIRAKYDSQTRQQLAEQLAVSRDLTKKMKAHDVSDEDEDDDANKPMASFSEDKDNPWITVKPASEIGEFISGYRKYWDERNKQAHASTRNTEDEVSNEAKKIDMLSDSFDPSCVSEGTNQQSQKSSGNIQEVGEVENIISKETEIQEGGEQSKSDNLVNNLSEYVTQCATEEKEGVDKQNKNKCERENRDVTCKKKLNINKIEKKSKINSDIESTCKRTAMKRTVKRKVTSTSSSWIVTHITDHKPSNSDTSQSQIDKRIVTNKRVETFLSSVVPDTSGKEGNVKKKKKTKLDKIFEAAENNISMKIQGKLNKLKSSFDSKSKENSNMEEPQPREEENDLGASLALKNTKEMRPTEDTELMEGPFENSKKVMDTAELIRRASGISGSNSNGVTDGRVNVVGTNTLADLKGNSVKPGDVNINPENFIAAKPKVLLTAVPEIVMAGEEALDDEMEGDQQKMISEAFADDNVLDDFRKEKEEEIKQSQPGQIDLSLPGWGEWGGAGIVKRKKSRFIIKPPPAPVRRDAEKSHLIINEEESTSIREHQVCELPEPFKYVKDFEACIRAPIGSTWIPETAHKKLVHPAVITKLGTVIKPMDEEFLVNEKTLLEFAD